MSIRNLRSALFPSLLGSLLAIATGCAAPADDAEADSDLIGGVEASSASLDAIGALVLESPNTPKAQFCTGALIAPNIVLTAKHCAIVLADPNVPGSTTQPYTAFGTVTFAIGSNSAAPKREVRATSTILAPLDEGGIGYGADMAVYILESPISDITPLPVTSKAVGEADIGKAFVAMGYGVRDVAQNAGRRTMGNVTLSLVEGKAREAAFGSFEAFRQFYVDEFGALTPQEEAALTEMYGQELLSGYEIFMGPKDGDAQVCSGDSGGPLLRKVRGKLTVFGVASWVPVKGAKNPCSHGATYVTFGDAARELLKMAAAVPESPCGDVPVAGRCDGDVAVRCIGSDEASPRVTKTSCKDVSQVCGIVDGKAACIDP